MAEIEITDVIPRNRYVSTGGEPSFEYNYPIFDADHLVVKETDPLDPNNPVTLVRGVDYAVTGVGVETGGTVVLDVGVYPTGAIDDNIYTIYRQLPYERLNDYQFSGDFESEDINTDLDSVVMMAQQLNRDLQGTIRLDETDELTSLPIEVETSAARAGRALTFAADGQSVGAGPSAQDIEDAGPNATAAAASATSAQGYRDEALIYRNEAQAAAAGMKRKTPARAATTGALPSSNYANGTAGVGATITATANGAWSSANSDGVALGLGEAIVVKNEAATLRHGIYTLTQVGTAGTPWILTRQTDSDTWNEIVAALVTITEGATYADTDFLCTSNAGGTMGTTAITWQQQNSTIADGAVSTAAKIADGIITYVKLATAALATAVSDLTSGVASKLVTAAIFKAWLDTKYVLVNPTTITTGIALAQSYNAPGGMTPVEFTVFLNAFSTNGTAVPIFQLSDAGGPETSGYSSIADSVSQTTGVSLGGNTASNSYTGFITFKLVDSANNTWAWGGVIGLPSSPNTIKIAGAKSLSQPLSGFRLTTIGGTDQADAGTLGIEWKG